MLLNFFDLFSERKTRKEQISGAKGQIPDVEKMLRFFWAEKVLNIDNQWLARHYKSIVAVGWTGKGFVARDERGIILGATEL